MSDMLLAIPFGLWIFILTLFGLIVGSFLNVVIYRLPIMLQHSWHQECTHFLNELSPSPTDPHFNHACPYCQQQHSILPLPTPTAHNAVNLCYPRSYCPICNKPIAAYHNIPILSYLWLRGRCTDCGTRISLRYPFVEALTAVLFILGFIHFGITLQFAAALVLTSLLIVLTMIDYDLSILPDNLTLSGLWLGLLLSLYPVFVDAQTAVLGAAAGYLSLFLVCWVFKLITGKQGMGHGDFKLLALLGAWLGWQQLPFIILCSSFVGAVIGIGLIISGKQKFDKPLPFGPYLAIAGWIALLYGDTIVQHYLQFAGFNHV